MNPPDDPRGPATDPLDGLIAVAHHALGQAARAALEAAAARRAHDPELLGFLEEVRDQERALAERCKTLLAARLGQPTPRSAQERVEEASEQSFPASDAPAY